MTNLISKIKENTIQAKPFGAVIKFDTGEGGVICIDGNGEKVTFVTEDMDANTTISRTGKNLEKLLQGKLNPAMAVMNGKLKVQGDMSLALKLASLL